MKIKKVKNKKYPKFMYEKEDDVLNIWLSHKNFDHAEQEGDIIVHFTQDNEPVYLEILDASNFLRDQSKALPKELKQKFFSAI